MGNLAGGTTISGYLAIHSGLTQMSLSGNITMAMDKRLVFDGNSTWGKKLAVGGNGYGGDVNTASMATTDGNLHLDAADNTSTVYLNFYGGTGGTLFGNGASANVAKIDASGVGMFGTTGVYNGSQLIAHKAGDYWHATIGDVGAGVLKLAGNAGSGGVIQSFNQATSAIRDLYLQRDGGKVGIGTANATHTLTVNGDSMVNGWMRTTGATGWYSETYGGGWHMTDTSWVRAYSGKSIFTTGTVRGEAGIETKEVRFWSNANLGSDAAWVRYEDDNNSYGYWGDTNENSALLIGVSNDGRNANSDVIVFQASGAAIYDTVLYPGTTNGRMVIPVGTDKYAT
jgi:hypothetical protein